MTTHQPAALPELPHTTYSLFYEQPGDLEDEGYQYVLDEPGYTADQMNARYTQGYNDALAALQAQPAEVSDATLQAIDDAHDWQTTAGRIAAYRAILALRPQASATAAEQEKELRRSLAEAQATISERNAEIIELQKRIRRSLQAVPMTEGTARQFVEWMKAQPEDREPTTIDGALAEFEAHHGITAQGAQGGEADRG